MLGATSVDSFKYTRMYNTFSPYSINFIIYFYFYYTAFLIVMPNQITNTKAFGLTT